MYTYASTISFTYPAGLQTLHANMHVDETGIYFASGNRIYAFNLDGTRAAARDIMTLENHPTAQTIWGFTKSGGLWYIMTRETSSTDSRQIGLVRVFNEAGRAQRVFSIPNNITGVNTVATPWRAQKGLAVIGNKLYTRVVRHASIVRTDTRMRFIAFELPSGNALSDDNLVNNSAVTSLSDVATNGYEYLIIIQQNQRIAYTVDTDDNFMEVVAHRTNLWDGVPGATQATDITTWAASAHESTLYVADRTNSRIYSYTGVPLPPAPGATGDGGSGGVIMSLANVVVTNAMMGRSLNRRRQRR